MHRRTMDLLASTAGVIAAVVLTVAGIYFGQRADFAANNVRDQLVAQRISFPALNASTKMESSASCAASSTSFGSFQSLVPSKVMSATS